MSNIKATIVNLGESTHRISQTKTTYKRIQYSDMAIGLFSSADSSDPTFYPKDVQMAAYFYALEDCAVLQPSFISNPVWEKIKGSSSGFLSGNGTIMPKMLFPTLEVCNNGIGWSNDKMMVDPKKYAESFTWTQDLFNSDAKMSEIDDFFWGERSSKTDGYGYVTNADRKHTDDDHGVMNRAYNLVEHDSIVSEYYNAPLIGNEDGGASCAFTLSFSPVLANNIDTQAANIQMVNKCILTMGEIEITLQKSGSMNVMINDIKNSGSLLKSQSSAEPGQTIGRDEIGLYVLLVYPVWNGIVCSAGIQDSSNLVDSASFYCKKNININIADMCNPLFSEYPPSDGPTDVEVKYDTSVTTNWGKEVDAQWVSGLGTFSYTPAFFTPRCQWTVFFRQADNDANNTYSFKAYSIYANDTHTSSIIALSDIIRIEGSEADDGTVCYKIDFEIFNDNSKMWIRRGVETWGFILETTQTTKSPLVQNSNGNFGGLTFGDGAISLPMWYEYITDMNISLGMESCTGSINLDKYAMMDQSVEPDQKIGGLKIDVNGGNENVIRGGRVFSGIAMEISDNLSEGSDTLTISLFGLEKKLDDIKLVNAPFWDGDEIGDVADWLGAYGGIQISFAHGDRKLPLPRSSDFEKPAINFTMGTSVIEALRKIAGYTNQTFAIQKDSIGYFYLNDDYGIPKISYNGLIHNYTSSQVITVANNPTFVNMYNTYMTIGLIGGSQGGTSPMTNNVFPALRFDHKKTEPNYPWSRIFVSGEQGYLTSADLDRLHELNMKAGAHYQMTGSIVVPGNAQANLFDRIKVDDEEYYIHSIGHSISFQSKEWTTSFQVSKTQK